MSPPKERPAPLVPPEVDLSSLPYMPLFIAKLRASKAWLICKRRPELAYYLVNLWTRAYQSRPAGSIEADDDVLCDAAGCQNFEQWVDLKSDLLRNWTLCSDDRYYCPGMLDIVHEGWLTVQRNKKRAKAGAAGRWGKRDDNVTDTTSNASSIPQASGKNAMDGRMDGLTNKHPPSSRAARANGDGTPTKCHAEGCTAGGTHPFRGSVYCLAHSVEAKRTAPAVPRPAEKH